MAVIADRPQVQVQVVDINQARIDAWKMPTSPSCRSMNPDSTMLYTGAGTQPTFFSYVAVGSPLQTWCSFR